MNYFSVTNNFSGRNYLVYIKLYLFAWNTKVIATSKYLETSFNQIKVYFLQYITSFKVLLTCNICLYHFLSQGGSIIPNVSPNCRSNDKNHRSHDVSKIFHFFHVTYKFVKYLEKKPLRVWLTFQKYTSSYEIVTFCKVYSSITFLCCDVTIPTLHTIKRICIKPVITICP